MSLRSLQGGLSSDGGGETRPYTHLITLALSRQRHPAVESVLKRLVDTVATITAAEPLRATVLPKQLLINGRAPALVRAGS